MPRFILIPLLAFGTIAGFSHGFHSLHRARGCPMAQAPAQRFAPAPPPAPVAAPTPAPVAAPTPAPQTLVIPIIVGVPAGAQPAPIAIPIPTASQPAQPPAR